MTGAQAPAVHALSLPCPACGAIASHRVLHVSAFREGSTLSGVARCGACHAVHPFEVRLSKSRVKAIASDGAVSRRMVLELDPDRRLTLGDCLEETERKFLVSRIETRTSSQARTALAKHIRVLWVVPGDSVRVKISVTAGSLTFPEVLVLSPESPLRVGDRIDLEKGSVIISGLRIGNQTLSLRGEGGVASEVRRVYAHPFRRGTPRPAPIRREGGQRYRTRFRPVGPGPRPRAARTE